MPLTFFRLKLLTNYYNVKAIVQQICTNLLKYKTERYRPIGPKELGL